jgi:hypothetical protein
MSTLRRAPRDALRAANGLTKWSSAPSSKPLTLSLGSPLAVRMRIGSEAVSAAQKGVTLRLTSATNQCAQKMLLCEVRMKNAFGSEYVGKLVMRLCGQDCLQKPWN